MPRTTFLSLLFLFAVLSSRFAHATGPTKEFIFTSAPFASAHASTIVELKNGEYLASWFGGTAEGKPDVAIWAARRSSTGWTKPVELAREPNAPAWNPVLFHARNGRLWLYYKVGPSYTWWTAARRYSDDEGITWSPAVHLPAGIYGPIRAKPLVLDDGTIVSGSSVESYRSWASWIERSVDDGVNWSRIGPITLPALHESTVVTEELSQTSIGMIQPSVVAMDATHLRLYARSSPQIGKICIADSHDRGVTWSDARPTTLPNPNSGIDAVRLKDGRFVLLYNNATSGRTPLTLAVSADGEHFDNFADLETDAGEFSYPALIQGSDGNLHITYTWNRKRIRYVVLPIADVKSKPQH